MHEIEAVVNDLQWRRLRRRVAMHPAMARICNCATVAMIIVLKLIAPASAR